MPKLLDTLPPLNTQSLPHLSVLNIWYSLSLFLNEFSIMTLSDVVRFIVVFL